MSMARLMADNMNLITLPAYCQYCILAMTIVKMLASAKWFCNGTKNDAVNAMVDTTNAMMKNSFASDSCAAWNASLHA